MVRKKENENKKTIIVIFNILLYINIYRSIFFIKYFFPYWNKYVIDLIKLIQIKNKSKKNVEINWACGFFQYDYNRKVTVKRQEPIKLFPVINRFKRKKSFSFMMKMIL